MWSLNSADIFLNTCRYEVLGMTRLIVNAARRVIVHSASWASHFAL